MQQWLIRASYLPAWGFKCSRQLWEQRTGEMGTIWAIKTKWTFLPLFKPFSVIQEVIPRDGRISYALASPNSIFWALQKGGWIVFVAWCTAVAEGTRWNISIWSFNISWKNWFAAVLMPRWGAAHIPLWSLMTIHAEAWQSSLCGYFHLA